MAANPYMLNQDVTVTWDGVSQRLMRGTVIDTPAASGTNLAQTILNAAASSLTALTSAQQQAANGNSVGPFCENLVGGGNEPSHYQN